MAADEYHDRFFFTGDSPAAPNSGWTPALEPEENGKGWEVVSYSLYDDFSIFPPSRHEGLHLRPDPDLDPPETLMPPDPAPVSGEPSSSPAKGDEEEENEWVRRGRMASESVMKWVPLRLNLIREKIWRKGHVGEGAMWAVAALGGVAAAVVYTWRKQRRENELLLSLVREKDQRIKLLLQQIALMNEMAAARYQISVCKK